MQRRHFLRLAGAAPVLSLLASGPANAAPGDYRALLCLFMSGGNDGFNCLLPTDAAYADYASARPALALAKDSLVALAGSSAGHRFAMHPAMAPLASCYNQGRLAWIANVGALLQATSARQVLEHSARLPPFLLSHSDQVSWQQGWLGDTDGSGWAGRGLELLPTALHNDLAAVTLSPQRTLVTGRSAPVAYLSPGDARYWGRSDLAQPASADAQALSRMAQWQFANRYDAEYARSFGRSLQEAVSFTQAALAAVAPKAEFGSDPLAASLKRLASLLPVFRSRGYRRQVFLIHWGNFDTHTDQLGARALSQDSQLATMSKALAAFDTANQAAGLDQSVATLGLSEFGRTLRPASGGGSDHGWGNHWFALGGPVAGGQVLGSFPTLVAGGPDDGDAQRGGRMVPTTSTDQVGASLMQWLGLPAEQLTTAFPYLANFSQKTLALMRS